MKKNTVVGWVLIAVIMIGFMMFQSKQIEKQRAAQLAQQHRRDSIELVRDSLIAAGVITEEKEPVAQAVAEEAPAEAAEEVPAVAAEEVEAQLVTLSNDKLELRITTKGAQPYSARVKDYTNYDKSDLYIFNCDANPNSCTYNVAIFVNDLVNTKDYDFEVASVTDSSVVMRLPFTSGGYIEQAYTLGKGSYLVGNTLSFVDLDIPKNVFSYDIDWNVIIPRMEKGYRNEVMYSKAAYRLDGDNDPEEFAKGRGDRISVNSKISWLAYHQQFFSAIFRAKDNFDALQSAVVFVPSRWAAASSACSPNT